MVVQTHLTMPADHSFYHFKYSIVVLGGPVRTPAAWETEHLVWALWCVLCLLMRVALPSVVSVMAPCFHRAVAVSVLPVTMFHCVVYGRVPSTNA